MLESLKPRPGKRWPRGQKFRISLLGDEADLAYREAIQLSRAQGRDALFAAERSWAEPRRVKATDGVILAELRGGKKSIADVARALEDCGTTPAEVKDSVDRLVEAGLVEPASAGAAAVVA